ncbi:AAA family ATPase [Paenibacillus sp. GSMTC-2017]|uniref:AAA family ATPase n=1 Tax=Paenibacillus sp. GSMTC-2017 TaxID=2794350 RepID=UPI0018D5B8AA|nr:AAA family ATPase [Paenibacillus sp. GSMTC-2017]MBH5317476.1 AAA family ATPase [Paenibacillus sp. GSMTC-2017]
MKRYQLAIAVKEKEYSLRLAEYVRSSPFGDRWQISVFTHPNACKQFLNQGYNIDLLAAEPDLLAELQPDLSQIPSIALVSKLGESGEKFELLQYQSLPQLLRGMSGHFDVMSQMGKQSSKGSRNKVTILTVHSASGGVGKTTFALHLANAASNLGHRTFYLNLERFNTANLWLNHDGSEYESGVGLSDLLYGIKTRAQLSDQWLLQHRKYHSLLKCDYLPSFTNLEDRLSLSAEDAVAIVNTISESGHYDVIVLDMEDGLDELHVSLLERADHNFWIVNGEQSVLRKQQLAEKYGEQKWGEQFQSLIRKSELVCNRVDEVSKHKSNGLKFAPYSLPDVQEWRTGEPHILLSSSHYRAAVGKLLKHVLSEGDHAYGIR